MGGGEGQKINFFFREIIIFGTANKKFLIKLFFEIGIFKLINQNR